MNRLIKELETISIELPGSYPFEFTNSALEPIFNNNDVSVIALGEAAHGSSILFELKHRIFKYLVEEMNCRALCYEFSFEKGLDINRYILYGEGNLDSLLYNEYWIQSNNTIKDLLQWMRDFNTGRDISEKVHFVGIDNQLDMFNPWRLKYHFDLYNRELSEYLQNELGSF